MEIRKINVNGKEYEFVNESGSTRSGFYHRSTLFAPNGRRIVSNKVNYLNRTWECYRYQTSMCGAVRMLINDRYDVLRNDFMNRNGYKKMTEKRLAEFKESNEYKNDASMNEYTIILENLKKSM